MTFVIGRSGGLDAGPVCRLGTYRALDGSDGADLYMDLDRPHAVLVVGKRGYGKSYTLGVVAEALARSSGVAPVLVDPMGELDALSEGAPDESVPCTVVDQPRVDPGTLDPRSWCTLLSLSPESGVGALVWQAARTADTLPEMRDAVTRTESPLADQRAALNHLELAASWGLFDPAGLTPADLATGQVTLLDVSRLDRAPMNAVVRSVGESLYRACVDSTIDRLPWLLLDEAHAFFDGVARPTLETLVTRGRAPGVSVVLATQRPAVVPAVAVSQSDVFVAHRLTAERDLDALQAAQPTYVQNAIEAQLPDRPGEVLIVDDATETVHAATVRERDTPHGGGSPRASDVPVED